MLPHKYKSVLKKLDQDFSKMPSLILRLPHLPGSLKNCLFLWLEVAQILIRSGPSVAEVPSIGFPTYGPSSPFKTTSSEACSEI